MRRSWRAAWRVVGPPVDMVLQRASSMGFSLCSRRLVFGLRTSLGNQPPLSSALFDDRHNAQAATALCGCLLFSGTCAVVVVASQRALTSEQVAPVFPSTLQAFLLVEPVDAPHRYADLLGDRVRAAQDIVGDALGVVS